MSVILRRLTLFIFLAFCLIIFHTYINLFFYINHITDFFTSVLPGGDIDRHPLYFTQVKYLVSLFGYLPDSPSIRNVIVVIQSLYQSLFLVTIFSLLRFTKVNILFSILISFLFFFSNYVFPNLFITLEDNVIYYSFLLIFFNFLYSNNDFEFKVKEHYFILIQSLLLFICISLNISLLIFCFLIFLTPVFFYLKNYKQAKRMFFIPLLSIVFFHIYFYFAYPKVSRSPFVFYLKKALSMYDGMATTPNLDITVNLVNFIPKAIYGFTKSFTGDLQYSDIGIVFISFYVIFFFFIYTLIKEMFLYSKQRSNYTQFLLTFVLFGIITIYSHVFESFMIERWDMYPLLIFILFINFKKQLFANTFISTFTIVIAITGLSCLDDHSSVIEFYNRKGKAIPLAYPSDVYSKKDCVIFTSLDNFPRISIILGKFKVNSLPLVYLEKNNEYYPIQRPLFYIPHQTKPLSLDRDSCIVGNPSTN